MFKPEPLLDHHAVHSNSENGLDHEAKPKSCTEKAGIYDGLHPVLFHEFFSYLEKIVAINPTTVFFFLSIFSPSCFFLLDPSSCISTPYIDLPLFQNGGWQNPDC